MVAPTVVAPFRNSHVGRRASDSNRALRSIGIPFKVQTPTQDFDIVVDPLTLSPLSLGGVITEQAVDFVGQWDNSAAAGSKVTDFTTEANEATAADVDLIPATEQDEVDFAIFGQVEPFFALGLTNATVAAGGAWAFEYLNNRGEWAALPAETYYDGTSAFTNTTDKSYFVFTPPEDWVPGGGGGLYDNDGVIAEVETTLSDALTARYYIRFRVTTVFSTNPTIDQVEVCELNAAAVAEAVIAPATGVINAFTISAVTAGGANNDVNILIINHTRQTRGLFSFNSAALNVERAVATYGLYVEQGDELTFHCVQEDGTTELQTVELFPEINI